ncbi:cupredoxin domain-containing protein [Labrys wisconsinensis]|uniref:Plastocyanin n=1 Tax=Labrys wisconsinensis TaxID=425677 RepID=A0ABU0J018_9HYPH|nr:cupredoxin family copper-binding protein [Labrys wisconsinensis]MDQ0467617.1 plastocyanin [Labrys wisconsinensis]
MTISPLAGAVLRGLAGLAALAAAPALAGETAAAAPAAVTVTIDNFSFTPAVATVTPGTTVTWVNHDDIPHTVVETDKAFRSKALDTDDRFSFTFTTPGDYAYFCSLHPHMTGKIIVRPGAG